MCIYIHTLKTWLDDIFTPTHTILVTSGFYSGSNCHQDPEELQVPSDVSHTDGRPYATNTLCVILVVLVLAPVIFATLAKGHTTFKRPIDWTCCLQVNWTQHMFYLFAKFDPLKLVETYKSFCITHFIFWINHHMSWDLRLENRGCQATSPKEWQEKRSASRQFWISRCS